MQSTNTCTYTHTLTAYRETSHTQIHTFIHEDTQTHAHTHAHTHMRTHTRAHKHTQNPMHTDFTHTHTPLKLAHTKNTRAHTHTHTHTHTPHTHIHTHTHTLTTDTTQTVPALYLSTGVQQPSLQAPCSHIPSGQPPLPNDASPTHKRLHHELRQKGFSTFKFVRVAPDYYDQPLSFRQV